MSLSQYLKLFAGGAIPARRRRRSAGTRLCLRLRLEALEHRVVLSFATVPIFAAGNSPVAVVSADFNGDGKADAAVVNEKANTVSILLGSGDGSFEPAQDYAAGFGPDSVVAADFNGDGKIDLAVTDDGVGEVTVLLGNGDGTFRAGISSNAPLDPHGAVAGDFNGDGKLDLAVANAFSAIVPAGARGTLVMEEFGTFSILPGNGDGTFQAPQDPPPGSLFNADADPQLAAIPVPGGGDELAVTMIRPSPVPSSAEVPDRSRTVPPASSSPAPTPIFTAPASFNPGRRTRSLSPDSDHRWATSMATGSRTSPSAGPARGASCSATPTARSRRRSIHRTSTARRLPATSTATASPISPSSVPTW